MALAMLFLATLPALGASGLIWWRLRAASMSFIAFCGTSALVLNIYLIVDPDGSSAFDLLKWWLASFGASWLLVFTALKLTRRASDTLLS